MQIVPRVVSIYNRQTVETPAQSVLHGIVARLVLLINSACM